MWKSSLQTEIALSTLESEYIALAAAMRELIPARRLLEEIVSHIDPKAKKEVPKIQSVIWEDKKWVHINCTGTKTDPQNQAYSS